MLSNYAWYYICSAGICFAVSFIEPTWLCTTSWDISINNKLAMVIHKKWATIGWLIWNKMKFLHLKTFVCDDSILF